MSNHARDTLVRELIMFSNISYPALFHQFLIRNGEGNVKPPIQPSRMYQPKRCFYNAFDYVMKHSDCFYMEGVVTRNDWPVTIPHAWVMKGNKTIEPTMRDIDNMAYYGIKFTKEIMLKQVLTNGLHDSIISPNEIHDIDFMMQFDPGMKEIYEKTKNTA